MLLEQRMKINGRSAEHEIGPDAFVRA